MDSGFQSLFIHFYLLFFFNFSKITFFIITFHRFLFIIIFLFFENNFIHMNKIRCWWHCKFVKLWWDAIRADIETTWNSSNW